MVSVVRLIKTTFAWTSFVIGGISNCFLLWLIARHTPPPMRVYGKILLQTCITDLIMLVLTVLNDDIFFAADNGTAMWTNGLLKVRSKDDIVWAWPLQFVWEFLIYVSLFGFVAQFIYRYLTLNRSMDISLGRYFLLLVACIGIPFIYIVVTFIGYYPPADHRVLQDETIARILGMNASDVIFTGYSAGGPIMLYITYYIVGASTVAYAVMIVLGYLMRRYVMENLSGASNTQKKTLEVQRQLTMALIVQAALPATIYIPLLFLLITILFTIDLDPTVMTYYTMLSSMPMYAPTAVNGLVAILMIREYRRATIVLLCSRMDNKQKTTVLQPSGVQQPPRVTASNVIFVTQTSPAMTTNRGSGLTNFSNARRPPGLTMVG